MWKEGSRQGGERGRHLGKGGDGEGERGEGEWGSQTVPPLLYHCSPPDNVPVCNCGEVALLLTVRREDSNNKGE